ncbi:MAG TPA: cytidylate kinase-like family protein [Spirochaetota bacterium]|nr:cytidylate kinase-like family protein [Spirochaetota bacterium]HPS87155.1 cytidylate kinase-like family protein [Spirochaetota bacterium]
MKQNKHFIITISRQLGSGGAYIGQQLAKKLNILYADREIIRKAARELSVLVADLESRDEKILSFWQSFLQFSAFVPEAYVPPRIMLPTDRELFETESEIIKHIAEEHSAVIIGRCGFHILRKHPHHISIFLHGDTASRNARIQKLYHVSEEDAAEMISKSDKERSFYCKSFTGKEWTDARNYSISIDTGKMDIDKSVEFILSCLKKIL